MANPVPVIDFSPIFTTLIRFVPLLIIIGVVGILFDSIGRSKRRSRRKSARQSPLDLIVELIAAIVKGLLYLLRNVVSHSPISFKPHPMSSVACETPDPSPATSSISPTQMAHDPKQSEWTIDGLKQLEWKRLEILTTELFKAIGFNAKMTRVGADGGVDVMLYQMGQDTPVGIAQCKAWTTYSVGVKPVRELYGVMAAEHVKHGVFVTTSVFTEEASDFAKGKNLELVDGQRLLHFINQLEPMRRQELRRIAFAGDYSTPTCPNCNIKMVLRTASKGRDIGSHFWGCAKYPRCRQTFRISSSQSEA